MSTDTYAIFDPNGQMEYVSTAKNISKESCKAGFLSILSLRWDYPQKWDTFEESGYTVRPVTITEREEAR